RCHDVCLHRGFD
ncbi:hypothetical protein CP061683_0460B, partial [Chlamydia psittaci 06-1683]